MTVKFEYKIVSLYLVIGGLWILFSDKILFNLVHDRVELSNIQTYKGWFYVFVTAILIYVLLNRHLKNLRLVKAEILHKNEELERTKETAEKSDQLKTIFLQNISHELRTPMNGIMGFSQILLNTGIYDEKQKKYLQIITDSSNQLLRIVDDIMEISKIETDSIQVCENSFQVDQLLRKIYSLFDLEAVRKGIRLKANHGKENEHCVIVSDEQKIRQILTNLLSNAIKYTTDGNIEFGYELEKTEIKFFVSDTGIGIEKELQMKIFERFERSPEALISTDRGTGLGLAISRGLLKNLGGNIWVDSEPGRGSTFYFTIPLTNRQIIH